MARNRSFDLCSTNTSRTCLVKRRILSHGREYRLRFDLERRAFDFIRSGSRGRAQRRAVEDGGTKLVSIPRKAMESRGKFDAREVFDSYECKGISYNGKKLSLCGYYASLSPILSLCFRYQFPTKFMTLLELFWMNTCVEGRSWKFFLTKR